MKSIEIKGLIREATGKTSTNSVRKHGNVPCVLYGGNEIIHFTASEIGFKDLVYTAAAHTVILDLGDKKKMPIGDKTASRRMSNSKELETLKRRGQTRNQARGRRAREGGRAKGCRAPEVAGDEADARAVGGDAVSAIVTRAASLHCPLDGAVQLESCGGRPASLAT